RASLKPKLCSGAFDSGLKSLQARRWMPTIKRLSSPASRLRGGYFWAVYWSRVQGRCPWRFRFHLVKQSMKLSRTLVEKLVKARKAIPLSPSEFGPKAGRRDLMFVPFSEDGVAGSFRHTRRLRLPSSTRFLLLLCYLPLSR